jgi:hypothetical protein
VLPEGVTLLSVEQNTGAVPWSWWIKWDTLYYLDADLKEHEVEGTAVRDDQAFKRPIEGSETVDD